VIFRVSGYIECPNGCCEQPKSVGDTLRLVMVPGPIIMLFISLVFIWYHPIDEKRRIEIQDELSNLR
jgi:Na+/melibiose symporter-like transporter